MKKSRWVGLLASLALAGCNYQIDKQHAEMPEDHTMMYRELCDAVIAPKCFKCHGGGNAAGGVALDDLEQLKKDGIIVPGKPEDSILYQVLMDDSMPEGPSKLSAQEKKAIHRWIADGAPVSPEDGDEPPEPTPVVTPPAVGFAELQAKVLAVSCVRCHRGEKPAGKISLESYDKITSQGIVIAGDPDASLLYRVVRDDVMPPKAKLTAGQKELLRSWIATGAKN